MDTLRKPPKMLTDGIKSKDLYGIPWRVALALQADGWYSRADIIEEVVRHRNFEVFMSRWSDKPPLRTGVSRAALDQRIRARPAPRRDEVPQPLVGAHSQI